MTLNFSFLMYHSNLPQSHPTKVEKKFVKETYQIPISLLHAQILQSNKKESFLFGRF